MIDNNERKSAVRGWVFVTLLALLFLVYGFFVFGVVGDKGPPEWDMGDVADTPGKSVYSTSPEPAGNRGEPATQHVSGRPSQVAEETKGNRQ